MNLGLGQPMEHVLRTCLLSLRARRTGRRRAGRPRRSHTTSHFCQPSAKIAEEQVYFDQLEILTQLGLVPEPATA